jgi:Na+/H+ antiporter NhaC
VRHVGVLSFLSLKTATFIKAKILQFHLTLIFVVVNFSMGEQTKTENPESGPSRK